jgi:uncharacterized protein
VLFAVFFFSSVILRAILGRVFGSLAAGTVTGVLAWFLSHVLPLAIGASAVAFVLSLLFGAAGGGRWSNLPRSGGFGGGGFGGGGFGGGGFGGGGFGSGGFGGGGGGFGGGGASGRW